MTKAYPNTFTAWQKEECGEVIKLNLDAMGEKYQSQYVFRYNFIMDRGWTRENKYWISPNPPYEKFKSIHNAYYSQRYREEVLKKK